MEKEGSEKKCKCKEKKKKPLLVKKNSNWKSEVMGVRSKYRVSFKDALLLAARIRREGS